jgi:HEPN domain-containing protein
MSDHTEEAQRLFEAAQRDYLSFQLLNETGRAPHETMGFLAQQGCEKLIKSAMVLHQISVERTHDLEFLHQLCLRGGLHLPVEPHVLCQLNPYAVALRYEGLDVEWISMADAEAILVKLLEFVQGKLQRN